ncbi:MAG: hypothetical protein M9962_04215, partial [Oligoflexia bacterium]|nr:hypothetical protein [Oligoflexia bacterium]
ANEDLELSDTMKADMAYENPETGAIISLNSICRKYQSSSLESLTNNLVRGIANRKTLETKSVKISNIDALESKFSGVVDGINLTIETVVLKKESCTYDFIFVVATDKVGSSIQEFKNFVASFRVSQ